MSRDIGDFVLLLNIYGRSPGVRAQDFKKNSYIF